MMESRNSTEQHRAQIQDKNVKQYDTEQYDKYGHQSQKHSASSTLPRLSMTGDYHQ